MRFMDESQVRWLNADEQAVWLELIAAVMWLPAALDAQLQRDAGLSHFEYGVLMHLSMSPNREARMSELASRANSTLPRMSKVIDRLAKQGWATRRPDPADGRYTLAALTEAGWEKVVASAPGHVEQVRRMVFDPLTAAQVRQLGAIAGKIAGAVRSEMTRPSSRSFIQ
jgi:DNA-binding MarR family transcriptional regulator